jgi:NAD(P)-dependent dehydrogenase (short-subunit alcohol dehydrogenase family)
LPFVTLPNKSILIIGGTTGLGFSAAKACLQAGAVITITGRNPERLAAALHELGKNATGLVADVMDPASTENAVSHALATHGVIDGLYHVAGGSGRRFGDGPLHEMTDEGLETTLQWNLMAMMRSNRAFTRYLLESQRSGSILNMGSVLGFSPSPRFFATHAYAAAKAGIIGFTKSAASCYAPHNIRFNVIAPALVETPMSERAAHDPAIQDFIKRKQPLDGGRIGSPSDLDAAAIWFLSDASRFCTGQVLAIDGGWSVSDGA